MKTKTALSVILLFTMFLFSACSEKPPKAEAERAIHDGWISGTFGSMVIVQSLDIEVLDIGKSETGSVGKIEAGSVRHWPVEFRATIKYVPSLMDQNTRIDIQRWNCNVWQD